MLTLIILLVVLVSFNESVQGYEVSETINPCDDYMEYACEGFNKIEENFKTITSEASYRSATFLWETRATALQMTTGDKYPMFEIFFKSCMDRVSRRKYGFDNIMKMLVDSYKGWPLLEECCAKGKTYGPWKLSELVVESYMSGEANLMKLRARRINETYIIEMKPVLTGLLNRYISDRVEEYEDYVGFLKAVIELFDGSRDSKDIPAMLGLEQLLVKLKQQWRPAMFEELKLSEFQEKLGEGGLDITEILKGVFKVVPWVEIKGETILMVQDVEYFVKANDILRNSSIRVVANYMIWRNVIVHFDTLPDKFHKIQSLRRMSSYLLSKPTQTSCLNKIVDYTFFKVYKDYLVRHYTQETQFELEKMFVTLVSTFDKSARGCFAKGMHEMDKLQNMKMVSGMQDTFNFDLVSKVYKSDLERSNYLENVLKMDRQLRALELSNYEIDGQLMKDRPLFEAIKKKQIVYDKEENVFYFPVNIYNASEPLDDDSRPNFYGNVGTAISYAMLRALSYGLYLKERQVLECRSKQENLFYSENENFREDAFIGKALDMAFLAHKNYLRDQNKRIREQGPLFVGFAQARCTKDQVIVNQTTRILINIFEFSSIYRCKSKERLFMKQSRCIRDC